MIGGIRPKRANVKADDVVIRVGRNDRFGNIIVLFDNGNKTDIVKAHTVLRAGQVYGIDAVGLGFQKHLRHVAAVELDKGIAVIKIHFGANAVPEIIEHIAVNRFAVAGNRASCNGKGKHLVFAVKKYDRVVRAGVRQEAEIKGLLAVCAGKALFKKRAFLHIADRILNIGVCRGARLPAVRNLLG